ncbi:MAG TPA: ABC-F family ATP-binding cassette domain-containing protein [Anaerolineales bacterium]|nr:ABC-F family ATP-binding cassette domain-containing protein [Anaerolineales bacterium]
MSLLTVTSLAKSFDPVDIFSGVSFSLPHRARYALVGPNGVGKTSLLRILAGRGAASGGSFNFARGVSVGYLPQEAGAGSERTLWEECLAAFGNLTEQETELGRLEVELGSRDLSEADLAELLERYGSLQARFEARGGYSYENQIEQVLTGLGFDPADYEYPLSKLSGGQRTRALLARLLLSGHDLLLLDEPTNHLDIQAVEWLESFLGNWDGAALIVSHDRYFLDRVATHILEMWRGSMEVYRGDYSTYVAEREIRWADRIRHFESEQARLLKELDFIKRNIAGQGVDQAKGRLRRLSRYLEAVEQVGFDGVRGVAWAKIASEVDYGAPMGVAELETRIKALTPPVVKQRGLDIRLKPGRRSGNIVLRTADLQAGYPGHPLFSTADLELHRLECAAVIGPNGAGKSTFLKTILGELPPLEGEVRLGASLDPAYFAQAHEGLDPNNSLIEEINTVSPRMLPGEVRGYLARFMFTGEDPFKEVRMLSGGERGRLALAKLALTPANLLLLDEPTNHLDIPAQEILQEALENYEGTTILVSHDRYLIGRLATQIWEIDVERGALRVFKGTYVEYRSEQAAAPAGSENGAEERVAYAEHKRRRNQEQGEIRRREERLREVEVLIHILEEQLAELGKRLENPPADLGRVQKLGEDYAEKERRLAELMGEWEVLHS